MTKTKFIIKLLIRNTIATFILFLISFNPKCFCQESINASNIYKKIHDFKPRYLSRAKSISKHTLKEYSSFYNLEPDSILNELSYFVIPMFDLGKNVKEYTPEKNLLDYLKIRKTAAFSEIIAFKSGKYFGDISQTEFKRYGYMIPEHESDTTRSYKKQMQLLNPYNQYVVFYIRGFLFTWWLINKDGEIKAFSLRDNKLYDYKDVITKYFPLETIQKICKNFYYY